MLVDALWHGTAVAGALAAGAFGPVEPTPAIAAGLLVLGTEAGVATMRAKKQPAASPPAEGGVRVALLEVASTLVPVGFLTLAVATRISGTPPDGAEADRTTEIVALAAALIVLAVRTVVNAGHHAEVNQRLGREATRDELTGLLNRRAVLDVLTLAEQDPTAGSETSVLLLDLDGFKGINDLHGHHAGDHVLIGVARRLEKCVRPTDAVARLGGDEFVVVVRGGDPHAVAQRIRDSVIRPLDWERFSLKVGCSVGVCRRDKGDGVTLSPDRMLDRADQALYRAKDLGGNVVIDVDESEPIGGSARPRTRKAKKAGTSRKAIGVS